MSGKIKMADLPQEIQRIIEPNERKRREQTSIEVIRKEAIKALASINTLETKDRERALNLALKMNKIWKEKENETKIHKRKIGGLCRIETRQMQWPKTPYEAQGRNKIGGLFSHL